MRLIDADALVERINALYEWCEDERKIGLEQAMCIIHEQPTAYDIDKIAEELALARERWNTEFMSSLDTYDIGRSRGYDDAIYIVRRGGVDER